MPSAFVPFLQSGGKTAASSNGSPRPESSDSAAGSSAFAALVPKATGTSGNPTDATAAHHHGGKPTISLQKDGDRVTHIRVACACGQVIELECAY